MHLKITQKIWNTITEFKCLLRRFETLTFKSMVFTTLSNRVFGSMYVSGKLPTYPSPNLTFCPKRELSVNVRFGEGKVGSFPETYTDPNCFLMLSRMSVSGVSWKPFAKINVHTMHVFYSFLDSFSVAAIQNIVKTTVHIRYKISDCSAAMYL